MACKISEVENGPLILKCRNDILYKEGKKVEKGDPAYLCRCSFSKQKPFCDGSHARVGYSSEREITEERIQLYAGREITISFNRSICAGAAECVRGLPSVFRSGYSKGWVYPDSGAKEEIIATIKRCPTGALSYSIDGETFIDKRADAKISIVKNGPYYVEGVALEHRPQPANFSTTKYALCRCGHSRNKPFCDFSHAENEWSDEQEMQI